MSDTMRDVNDGMLTPDPVVNRPVIRLAPARLLKAAFVIAAGVAAWLLVLALIL